MLRRIMDLAPGAGGTPKGSVEPSMVLDAFGRLAPFKGAVPPIPAESLAATPPAPDHPPGLYAPVRAATAGSDEQPARLALNLQPAVPQLVPLDRATLGPAPSPYARAPERELGPWLLSVALLLALADLLIGYVMRGLMPRLRRTGHRRGRGPPAAHAGPARPAGGRGRDRLAELANETHLAYVITGDAAVDQESEAGLKGLTRVLEQRTAVEAAAPVGGRHRPRTSWPCSRSSTGRSRRDQRRPGARDRAPREPTTCTTAA